MTLMKAIALTRYLPISDPNSLIEVEIETPVPTGRDILVKVEAISVNPVDTKIRAPKDKVEESPKILGWDAAGVVTAVGGEVSKFKPGDAVYYAGDLTRPGCNAEFQLVDERVVGRKPASLSFSEAAALPLTTLTAWESIFEKLGLDSTRGYPDRSVLIIGGAGGVGSIAIQLAKLAGLRVVATASRRETVDWVTNRGADFVIDHREPLSSQLVAIGYSQVDYICNFNSTVEYWDAMAEVIKPEGKIVCIVETSRPLDLNKLKNKSVTFAWELMFTRSLFKTPTMGLQGDILDTVAMLVDNGKIRTTLTESLSPINAANLREAHARLESGKTIGKVVLSGGFHFFSDTELTKGNI